MNNTNEEISPIWKNYIVAEKPIPPEMRQINEENIGRDDIVYWAIIIALLILIFFV